MTKYISILILIFLAWCFVSYRWYVCGIKELCTDTPTTETQPVEEIEETPVQPISGNLVSEYKNKAVLTNSETGQTLDSIKGLINGFDTLSIIGLYRGSESEQVGNYRAEAVAALVMQAGVDMAVAIKAKYVGADTSNLINKAVEFNLVSPKEVSDFAISEVDDKIIINFPTASANPAMNTALNERLKTLADEVIEKKLQLSISGHTDNTGTPETNDYYGLQRAQAIASVLKIDGVSDDQMIVVSKGEKERLETNDTVEGRAKNRRVEIIIIRN